MKRVLGYLNMIIGIVICINGEATGVGHIAIGMAILTDIRVDELEEKLNSKV